MHNVSKKKKSIFLIAKYDWKSFDKDIRLSGKIIAVLKII